MNESSNLEEFGYNQLFEDYRVAGGVAIEQVTRVTAEHKGAYELVGSDGVFRATVTGKRMLNAASRDDYPAVGDWVIINNEDSEPKVILDILPRKSTLHKKYGGKDERQLIAANVDVAFIVEAIDRDYSLNRFERYLVLAREGRIRPVIILNKSDLSLGDDVSRRINEIRERFVETEVLATSTLTDNGIDELENYIQKGITYCFLGSSGVGKSTLINKLLQQDRIATKAIGKKTGRGKHTTTSREMYITNSGGIIIDNPGSREVGLTDVRTGVSDVFANIENIARECKFKDCQHINEPLCAVKHAVSTSIISKSQYENYQKLRKETEHYERSAYEKRQKDKEFGKFIKNAKKDLKKF